MTEEHTPGPWEAGADLLVRTKGGWVIARCCATLGKYELEKPNARLISAAPDYYDAAHWIAQAVNNNAAPVNPLVALEELALDGKHITLDAGLVLDLLKAHAKATGAKQ